MHRAQWEIIQLYAPFSGIYSRYDLSEYLGVASVAVLYAPYKRVISPMRELIGRWKRCFIEPSIYNAYAACLKFPATLSSGDIVAIGDRIGLYAQAPIINDSKK